MQGSATMQDQATAPEVTRRVDRRVRDRLAAACKSRSRLPNLCPLDDLARHLNSKVARHQACGRERVRAEETRTHTQL